MSIVTPGGAQARPLWCCVVEINSVVGNRARGSRHGWSRNNPWPAETASSAKPLDFHIMRDDLVLGHPRQVVAFDGVNLPNPHTSVASSPAAT
jgi:hypothetical protein